MRRIKILWFNQPQFCEELRFDGIPRVGDSLELDFKEPVGRVALKVHTVLWEALQDGVMRPKIIVETDEEIQKPLDEIKRRR